MKKLVTAFALCAAMSAFAVDSQNIVGYQKGNLVGANWNLSVGVFNAVGGSGFNLNADLSGVNLTSDPADNADNSDQVWFWDVTSGAWYKYYLYLADGGSEYDGWWGITSFQRFEVDFPAGMPAGTPFWLITQAASVNASITSAGEVFAAPAKTNNMVKGNWNFMASPYPTPVSLNNTSVMTFTNATSDPADNADNSDQIWFWDVTSGSWYKYYLYLADGGSEYDGWWGITSFQRFEVDFPAGMPAGTGFWYIAQPGTGTVDLTFKKTF